MAKRLGIGGFQNSGKSFSRRWIPDGENVMALAPSLKSSYLFKGPANAKQLSPAELDAAVNDGTRVQLADFDLRSPDGKFETIDQAVSMLTTKNKKPEDVFSTLQNFLKHKAPDHFNPSCLKGNTLLCPTFQELQIGLNFVNNLLPWVHTVILPDFTHFITEILTSDEFRNRKFGNDAFARYADLAADAMRTFIKSSDTMRKDLVIVTEFHIEFKEAEGFYELFTPGGKMLKDKFLPSSYYDMFLFTDTKFNDANEDAEPEYVYVTRRTKKYPEARSMNLFENLYEPNNLQEALTRFRKHHNISL